jgi:hypothetical protein
MSTPESTPTHLPWATLCQSRPQPYARVDYIPQSVTLDLASGKFKNSKCITREPGCVFYHGSGPEKISGRSWVILAAPECSRDQYPAWIMRANYSWQLEILSLLAAGRWP